MKQVDCHVDAHPKTPILPVASIMIRNRRGILSVQRHSPVGTDYPFTYYN
jgi:hypothetical protein